MIWSVVLASIAVFSWKMLGYAVPRKFIGDGLKQFADRVTVVLLAALVGVQGFSSSGEIVIDARVLSLILAAILLSLRVPYIIVIIASAAVAALSRAVLGF